MASGTETKMGRPSPYKPEYCQDVIEWGKQGKSKAQIASRLNITRQTLDNWCEAHIDFFDAIKEAINHSQNWWEDVAQEAMDGRPANPGIWAKSMAARFPSDYTERTKQEITGLDGGAIRTESTVLLTPDEAYLRMLNGG